jgi:glycosyltransferase involved in cell wall biosynthesis
MNNAFLISIIIPVFNREKTILPCLDKILSQDSSEVEIIVVDDGSTDNSRSVIMQKTARYHNVKVLGSNVNKGPGVARNMGIMAAKGEYISFVDSDDLVEDNYIITLKEAINTYRCDLILFNYKRVYIRKKNLIERLYPFTVANLNKGVITDERMSLYTRVEVSSVIKLIKREILTSNSDILFPESSLAEDLSFSLLLYPSVHNYVILPDSLYQYHISENSQSRLVTNWTEIYLKILSDLTAYYKKHNYYFKNYTGLEFLLTKHLILPNLLRFYNHKSSRNYSDFLKLRFEVLQSFPNYLRNPFLKKEPFYSYLVLWLVKYIPRVFRLVI